MIDNSSGKSKIQTNSDAESKFDIFKDFQKLIMAANLTGPQRVRGTAGTGKTLFLAMKAAAAHFTNPRQKILVTFYTRSLEATLKELITRILRDMYHKEPNWAKIHVRHGWGGRHRIGVYSDACDRHKIPAISYSAAKKMGQIRWNTSVMIFCER